MITTPFFARGGQEENTAFQEERVAIVSAFGPEVVKLLSVAEIEEEIVINGRKFTLCEIEGKKAVLFMSGVSMVNAAMTTQMALDHFNITHILFSGRQKKERFCLPFFNQECCLPAQQNLSFFRSRIIRNYFIDNLKESLLKLECKENLT